jgi:hypothetical protein
MVTRITIISAYYSRPKEMMRVLKALRTAAVKKYNITHYIIDDLSPKHLSLESLNVGAVEKDNYIIEPFCTKENNGRLKYWITINAIMAEAKEKRADYVMFLPDDRLPCKRFFNRVFELYKTLPDNAMLNLDIDYARESMIPNQQLDGACIIPKNNMDNMNWEIEEVRPPTASSGVWRIMSANLLNANPTADVFYPTHSFLKHLCPKESQLNDGYRRTHPIVTKNFIDETPGDIGVYSRW